jgi:hypothetical protein
MFRSVAMNWLIFILLFFIMILDNVPVYAYLKLNFHSFTSFMDIPARRAMPAHRETVLNLGKPAEASGPVSLIKSSMEPLLVNGMLKSNGPVTAKDVASAVIGPVLNYPNPFPISTGTDIGYELSKSMDIQIYIYDIFSHLIYREEIPAGTPGAIGTPAYNTVHIDQNKVGRGLPVSAYFYFIVSEGKVLGKGKMAIVP